MVIDALSNWKRYPLTPRIARAFELLGGPSASTWPEGRTELEGDRIVAMPQSYPSRPAEQCRFEAHRRYLDIQYIVAGREKMGWALITNLAVETTYDEAKDVAFFAGTGDVVTVGAGMFTIFLPQDGHKPCIQAGAQAELVRKIVMKVALD